MRAIRRSWALASVLVFGLALPVAAQPARAAPPPTDLAGFAQAFDEPFRSLSISGVPGTGATWYNHTPWSGDFGDAVFAAPGQNGPFSPAPGGGLRITARKGPDGRWSSGLISSRDRDGPQGRGFIQQYGYFEMKAKLPSGPGVWPGFWLIGVDKHAVGAEIDVMEDYGRFPEYYHCVAHIWRLQGQNWAQDFLINVRSGQLSSDYNLFGVDIEDTVTTFYLNRKRVASMPTPPEYKQPFYILADLALGGGWPIKFLSSPQFMDVAYIRAYRRTGGPSGLSS